MAVALNLQGLSYEVFSAIIATIFRTRISFSSCFFFYMGHYTLAACCYITKIYELRLYGESLQLNWVNKCFICRFTNDSAVGQNTASDYCAVSLLSLANIDHSYR